MNLPFDSDKLNALLEENRIDLLLATSKHNIQYLLGGYRCSFFEWMDAFGMSRYLPMLGLPRGHLGDGFYVGNPIEKWQQANEPIWVEGPSNESWTCPEAAGEAAERIQKLGLSRGRIAIERAWMPIEAMAVLEDKLPDVEWVESIRVLEELRAVKTPEELKVLREASEAIVKSMLAVMTNTPAGTPTCEIVESLRREEIRNGLNFEYCLIAAGTSFIRAGSSDIRWEKGEVLSLDSGGNKRGYIGDLCRMAVMGEPTALMQKCLAEVQAIQAAARRPIKAGAIGGGIYEHALAQRDRCDHGDAVNFTAHGMGLITHEVPHLTDVGFSYPALHRNTPLEAGMVISIETEIRNKEVGFVKIEDTVAVTKDGCEAYGDQGREWNVVEG